MIINVSKVKIINFNLTSHVFENAIIFHDQHCKKTMTTFMQLSNDRQSGAFQIPGSSFR